MCSHKSRHAPLKPTTLGCSMLVSPFEFEEAAQQGDGPHTSIVQKFPLFDAAGEIYAIGAIVTDITDRKRSKEALRHSEERYRSVPKTATDAVVSIDQRGQIIFANPATTKTFGYQISEMRVPALAAIILEQWRSSNQNLERG
jgi:PAS domain-containing protein